nr:anaerobic glycerol-3-phosphate dehydrogenase subunit GlpB [Candidatus Njordarchaeum guaymaensis]
MKDFRTEVAVIGCGIAGLTAAKRIAREGVDVAVFSKAYGATAMSTGVVDVANPTVIKLPLKAPEQLIPEKYIRRTNHPYALILRREKQQEGHSAKSDRHGCGETISEAVADFLGAMKDVGYPMEGSLEHNMLLIDSIGSAKCTCLAPPSIARGDLTRIDKGQIVFVGFKGHPDYDPRLCSQNFGQTKKIVDLPTEVEEAGAKVIDFPDFEGRNTLLSIEVARRLDREEGVAMKVGRKIGDLSKGNGATHVCLPPCMGVENVEESLKVIGEESGLIAFECVNLAPPSILGFRLQLALDDSTSKSGVVVRLPYEVKGFETEENNLKRMIAVSGERSFHVNAERFILATGSFIGGGIVEEDETVKEPLLNLQLFDENDAQVNNVFVRRMLSSEAVPIKGHPVFSIGVKVNENMQPVSAKGAPTYSNLFACGNILSGFNHTSGGCRHGVAITTGYVAGEEASKKQTKTS